MLTEEQQHIFDGIIKRVHTHQGRTEAVIVGPAGTGKTFLVSNIVKELDRTGYSIAITSPTHKANAVIRKMVENIGVSEDDVQISTIHSFLGLKLVHEKNRQVLKLDQYNKPKGIVDVLLVDECSMISRDMYTYIQNQMNRVRRAIIFIGDSCQLPPVETEGTMDAAKLSPTFDIEMKFELKTVMRQALDNPIIKVATAVRQCIGTRNDPMSYLRDVTGMDTIIPCNDDSVFLDTYRQYIEEYSKDVNSLYETVLENRIVAYTNNRVNYANMHIRNGLFPDFSEVEFIPGEPIVFESITENCPYANQQIIKCPKLVPESFMGIDCWRMGDSSSSVLVVGPYSSLQLASHLDDLVKKIEGKKMNPISKRPYTWQDYYIIKNKINIVNYPYATTAHKSQGSTFDHIWFDTNFIDRIPNNDTKCRIIYTALTRPRYQIILRNN